ncbi:RNA polymerase sigma factor [Pedobacter sp. AW31-3R]|uniref:RNA polymerase sigma factor n=1 Tax=Pedobacter sp. AW31-3R TaxID=3445781 RepID=UPI003F9F5626
MEKLITGSIPDFTDKEDAALVDLINSGNRGAFNELYRRHVKMLTHYGFGFTKDLQVIEDCLHDLFLWIWTKKGTLLIQHSIKSYLFKSLRTSIVHRLEKDHRVDLMAEDEGELDRLSDLAFSVELASFSKEEEAIKQDKFNQLFKDLTSRQKELIYLRYKEEMSFEDMAQHFNISLKGCYKLMARAISSLREAAKGKKTSFILFLLTQRLKTNPDEVITLKIN